MNQRTERRRAPRGKPSTELRMTLPGHSAPVRVRDISASGVCCITDRPVPVLSQVSLVFVLPRDDGPREVHCTGAVVRCTREPRAADAFATAIFFTALRETDRAALADYVGTLRSDAVA